MYSLVVIKTSSLDSGGFPSSFTADDILYIDQKTADSTDAGNNSIVFSNFIPMNYTGGKAFMTGGSLSEPTEIGTLESHGLLGDVNDSNAVNVTDAMWVLQFSVNKRTFDDTQLLLADVNTSGAANVTDAMWILQRAVGKRNSDYQLVG